jgi:hypothetical protein
LKKGKNTWLLLLPEKPHSRISESVLNRLLKVVRPRKKSKLLIDFSPINSVPTFSDRFHLGENAVVFAEFVIKVAVVSPPGLIDPGRLGELVARNRGVNGHVFSDLTVARQWLLEESRD